MASSEIVYIKILKTTHFQVDKLIKRDFDVF